MIPDRPLDRLKGDLNGVTIVEFALLLPVMLLLICGTIEAGHMIMARVVLEGAVTEAARLATASLETNETDRDAIMRDSITRAMSDFATAPGQSLTITTTAFRNFSAAYPEDYDDTNHNGRYDLGEAFIDRNQNARWDDASPLTGSTLGGPGDVVSYTARFPKRVLFNFLAGTFGATNGMLPLTATTVVRNEAVVTKTSS